MSLATWWAGIQGGVVGGGLPAFTSDPYFVLDSAGAPPAQASIGLLSGGNVRALKLNSADLTIGTWQGGALTMSDYDFQMTTITGVLSATGTQLANIWINGFNGMFWGIREIGFGVDSYSGTLRVRPAGGGADIDTAGVLLNAETV